jgi:hypothetical protein
MKDGEDPLDRSCEEWRSTAKSQREEKFPENNKKKKTNWTGHILRTKCLLKPDMEGKIEGKMEVKERLGRRHKQLLDKLKEKLLEFERGSTRSLCMKHSLWKGLWASRKMTDFMKRVQNFNYSTMRCC